MLELAKSFSFHLSFSVKHMDNWLMIKRKKSTLRQYGEMKADKRSRGDKNTSSTARVGKAVACSGLDLCRL